MAGFSFSPILSFTLFLTAAMRRLTFVLLAILVTGCNLDTFRRHPLANGAGTFAKELHVDTTAMTHTASGLMYQDLIVGTGEAATEGRTVNAAYTGWLTNGKQFDTGRYRFQLGRQQAIEGWDEGLIGMKVGGKRKLVVPPSLGYGATGSPPVIPPNATLVFDVELLQVE